MTTAIVWFRRNLRLDDNPALRAALAAGHRIVPVFIHAPEEDGEWRPGAASDVWLHHSLTALKASLQTRGSDLLLFAEDSLSCLQRLARAVEAEVVYWNHRYEPGIPDDDSRIRRALRAADVRAESHNASLLHEPGTVTTARGDPYKVFTPFWRSLSSRLTHRPVHDAPMQFPALPAIDMTGLTTIEALKLRPARAWDSRFHETGSPGESGARQRLDRFVESSIDGYSDQRDFPNQDGTSRLSPHLHFGEVSPWRILDRIRGLRESGSPEADGWLRQLAWREFAHHLLHHFPETTNRPLDRRFDAFPWRENDDDLRAWQRGTTGIPIVDAGMRQLWQTGWMHNRVRMLVASLLSKNLRIHWLHGARWFWDTLVDADLANNTLGWQWTAGCGADAAPYFRIFNPVTQGERFDREGDYIARWVPELACLPPQWRHQPWLAPASSLAGIGLRSDSVYRRPIVDLKTSRQAALAAWHSLR